MWHQILTLLNTFNNYAKLNPVLAGIIGLMTGGAITAICIRIPRHLWNFVVRQCTTTITLNNNTMGNNLENFSSFLIWFQRNHFVRWSRTFAFDPAWRHTHEETRNGTTVGVGEGRHFFCWGGHFFWLTRRQMDLHTQSATVPSEIAITMLGRSHKKLYALIEQFRYKEPDDKIGIYRYNGDDWMRISDVPKRPLNTVMAPKELKEKILGNLHWFLANRDWYITRGRAYKQTYVLYGPSGTGKTSLIKALASELGLNLCLVNLARMTDSSLENALSQAPKCSILAFEDFDNSEAVKARKGMTYETPKKESGSARVAGAPTKKKDTSEQTINFTAGMLTLGGILNALDGLLALDGSIIFMTTNQIETVDRALVRKGRVDHLYQIGPLQDAEIREYIQVMFPDFHPADMEHVAVCGFKPILGCDLQDLFDEHKGSVCDFISAIPRNDFIVT